MGQPDGREPKIEWIQRHFGHQRGTSLWKQVILTHHKHLNRGDYLIDDRPNNGAAEFPLHNPGAQWLNFGSEQFPDWESVLAYLRPQAT
ncbi:MAG: hypothetical protein V9E81_05065 [Marmoricola sp.]